MDCSDLFTHEASFLVIFFEYIISKIHLTMRCIFYRISTVIERFFYFTTYFWVKKTFWQVIHTLFMQYILVYSPYKTITWVYIFYILTHWWEILYSSSVCFSWEYLVQKHLAHHCYLVVCDSNQIRWMSNKKNHPLEAVPKISRTISSRYFFIHILV